MMKRMASKISFSHVAIIILVLFLTRPSPLQLRNKNRHRIVAARYYVSPSGDDSNPGTIQSPWRTIQHAADSVNPGDTVQVRAGEWASYSGQDQHSMVSTVPRSEIFLNMEKRDLHIFQGSLAVDRGTLLNAPSVDHDCMIRPAGSGYDIGAYEYGSTIDLECIGEIKREKKGKLRR